jgi:hypothetical protein
MNPLTRLGRFDRADQGNFPAVSGALDAGAHLRAGIVERHVADDAFVASQGVHVADDTPRRHGQAADAPRACVELAGKLFKMRGKILV